MVVCFEIRRGPGILGTAYAHGWEGVADGCCYVRQRRGQEGRPGGKASLADVVQVALVLPLGFAKWSHPRRRRLCPPARGSALTGSLLSPAAQNSQSLVLGCMPPWSELGAGQASVRCCMCQNNIDTAWLWPILASARDWVYSYLTTCKHGCRHTLV